MRRAFCLAVCGLALGVAAPAANAGAARADDGAPAARVTSIDSYCSPTGDYCLGVTKLRGRIKLELATFSFRGRYELCVKGPKRKACKRFRLGRERDLYSDRIDWARKFGEQGEGRYRVSWRVLDDKLGRTLRFRI